jgi:ArsR family transcriptional regulator
MTRAMIRLREIECCEPVREPGVLTLDERQRLIGMFKALGDGTRLEIFRLIAAQVEPICACEIVERFEVSQPTVAHHTKVLREAGLITAEKRGIWAYYAVDRAGIAALGSAIAGFVPELDVVR